MHQAAAAAGMAADWCGGAWSAVAREEAVQGQQLCQGTLDPARQALTIPDAWLQRRSQQAQTPLQLLAEACQVLAAVEHAAQRIPPVTPLPFICGWQLHAPQVLVDAADQGALDMHLQAPHTQPKALFQDSCFI